MYSAHIRGKFESLRFMAITDLMLPKLNGLFIIEKPRDQGINTPANILRLKHTVNDGIR